MVLFVTTYLEKVKDRTTSDKEREIERYIFIIRERKINIYI